MGGTLIPVVGEEPQMLGEVEEQGSETVVVAAAAVVQLAGNTGSRQRSSGNHHMLRTDQLHSIEHTAHCSRQHLSFLEFLAPMG